MTLWYHDVLLGEQARSAGKARAIECATCHSRFELPTWATPTICPECPTPLRCPHGSLARVIESYALTKITCDYCGAMPTQACRTKFGREAQYPHWVRFFDAQAEIDAVGDEPGDEVVNDTRD